MSPVDAKKYGLIDHVGGGDEKTFQLDSSMYGTIGGAERYFKVALIVGVVHMDLHTFCVSELVETSVLKIVQAPCILLRLAPVQLPYVNRHGPFTHSLLIVFSCRYGICVLMPSSGKRARHWPSANEAQ